MSSSHDLIIIGAGSVGVPAAVTFAGQGLKVLVLESLPSPGQGENKKAIGGIRATHSERSKISVCQRSIEIFSTWQETTGDDIHWRTNGYSFPAWTRSTEAALKRLMKVQQSFGLNIGWLGPEEYRELNPGIRMEGLRGSTYSPEDGSASPLLFIESAFSKARRAGAEFRFNETVTGLETDGRRITAVRTARGRYPAGWVLNAAGSLAREAAALAGLKVPVQPDCHEAAVTEPVATLMGPMVVDVRSRPGSANFYFYQAPGGQVIFCLTVDPPILGTDTRATSSFLPMIAKRAGEVMPLLANLKIRRTWRGQYPMTPDGFPIVGPVREVDNFFLAVGMCGQGFMLGPGLAEYLFRLITAVPAPGDETVAASFDPYRPFEGKEAFK